MDNEILDKTQELTPDPVEEAAEKVVDESEVIDESVTSSPAFEYQPPEVTIPDPVQPESVQQPFQQQPVQQPYYPQQPVQQQPVQQPYYPQQPVQQQPYYPQQPVQQQPVQQPYYPQQPVQQPTAIPSTTEQYYQYTPVNPALLSQQNSADGFAIASLICSLAGLVCCCTVLPSLLAVIFGAISKAKNDGTRPTGMSTAGLVLGIIGLIFNLLVIMAMIYSN